MLTTPYDVPRPSLSLDGVDPGQVSDSFPVFVFSRTNYIQTRIIHVTLREHYKRVLWTSPIRRHLQTFAGVRSYPSGFVWFWTVRTCQVRGHLRTFAGILSYPVGFQWLCNRALFNFVGGRPLFLTNESFMPPPPFLSHWLPWVLELKARNWFEYCLRGSDVRISGRYSAVEISEKYTRGVVF